MDDTPVRRGVPLAVGRVDGGALPLLLDASLVVDAVALTSVLLALARARMLPVTAVRALYARGRRSFLPLLARDVDYLHSGGVHASLSCNYVLPFSAARECTGTRRCAPRGGRGCLFLSETRRKTR